MRALHIDIETYSETNLSDYGVYRYCEDPSFEILLFAYAWDNVPVQIVDLTQEALPTEILDALDNEDVEKVAFNAAFERVCIDRHFGLKTKNWTCSKVRAAMMGLSGSLEAVGRALALSEDQAKMKEGKALIRLFSLPQRPTKANGMKTRIHPADAPEKWQTYKDYCVRDVEAEREIERKLSFLPMPESERELYWLDQEINDRGVRVDIDLAESAKVIDEQQEALLVSRYEELTGIESPKKLQAMKDWILEVTGQEVTAITKGNMDALIASFQDYPAVAEAISIRKAISKSSVAKYKKMLALACRDERAKGLFQFFGASTGRWAGRGIQPQNLPRNYIDDLADAREIIRQRDYEWMAMVYDEPEDILSQCIRSALIPSKGKRFAVADFSAIEARVIAWLTGESWRMEVFRSHGKIYEASASQMFGVPIEEIGKGSPLRQRGKVAELALGYQGSVGAMKTMGALEMGIPESELQGIVDKWRGYNPHIVAFWSWIENACKGLPNNDFSPHVPLQIIREKGFMFIVLPSGRRIAYARPSTRPHEKFEGMDELTYQEIDHNKGWKTTGTYGGKLTENIVQAIARDCLAVSMQRVADAGYPIVMHIHDEIVVEVDHDDDLEKITEIMGQPVPWAEDLPLRADGYLCDFYMKD